MSSLQPQSSDHHPEVIRSAINTIILGQSFGAPLPQVLINGGVFSLLILQLGGSKFEVGLAFMLNFLAQTVRVFAGRYADVHDTKRMFVRWAQLSNVVFLLMFFVEPIRVAAGNNAAIWFACGVFFLQRTAINVGGTAWQPMMAEIIPTSLRGRFTGAMRRAFQAVSLVVIVLTGLYLGDEPSILRFYAVFAVLLASSVVRPILIGRLPSGRHEECAKPEKLIRNIARPFRDPHFRHFLFFWGYLVFAVNLARPFTVPFLKQDLGFPSSITIYSSALLVLGMAVSLLEWGRMADRLGNRLVFLLNILLISLAFVLLSLTPTFSDSPVLAVAVGAGSILFIGIAVGGQGIAHTVRIMHAAPETFRGSYMSAFFIVNGIIAGATSSLSGLLLDALPDSVQLLGNDVLFMRLYFPFAALLVLFAVPGLLKVKPISERPMRETISIFVESLPSVISLPLSAVRVLRSGVRDDDR